MRWFKFILVHTTLLALFAGVLYVHKDSINVVKKPPESLKHWYKPENKRQVWLHNMFKLRREIQAVRMYAEEKNSKLVNKWSSQLQEHYLNIADMVPEWKDMLLLTRIQSLADHTSNNDFQNIIKDLDALNESCESCHTDFRAMTAVLYRAPNFKQIMVDSDTTYNAHMKQLITMVNTIKIASEDGQLQIALKTSKDLEQGIVQLGESCVNCHKKPQMSFPNDALKNTMGRLQLSLDSGTLKDQGKALGALAVQACASCHATHRMVFDLKSVFQQPQDWSRVMH